MKMKISVIVPIFNCEEYLDKCLQSLKEQSYKDLEFILIDDGSTDKSGIICDKYTQNDYRFKVIHKKNEGVVAARNQGIELATGDYIGFVDSDDYCKKNMFAYLATIADENEADIACCGIERIYSETGATFYTRKNKGVKIYGKEEALERFFLPDYITTAVWNKIFKAEIAKRIRFKEYARNDDGWFVASSIMDSDRIVVGEECLYVYQIRKQSITRGNFSHNNYDILHSIDDIYAKAHYMYPHNKNLIVAKIFWYVVFIDDMILSGKEDKEAISNTKKIIRNNFSIIFRYEYLGFFRKFQFYVLSVSFNLYSLLYMLYCKLWGKQ